VEDTLRDISRKKFKSVQRKLWNDIYPTLDVLVNIPQKGEVQTDIYLHIMFSPPFTASQSSSSGSSTKCCIFFHHFDLS